MGPYTLLPDSPISPSGPVSDHFLSLKIRRFQDACRFVHELPYGYNSNRDEPMLLFSEKKGSCTTKHAVIATLAVEQGLPVGKVIGVYAMTEELVTGASAILEEYGLAYVPMVHCFLQSGSIRTDLTEGNHNGKRRAINDFLYTQAVSPTISEREEYRLYRKVLTDVILLRDELTGVPLFRVLKAREAGIVLLKANIR
jgi:hypothetical protein